MTSNLFPYTEIDGVRTVSDSEIKQLFKRTIDDELDKIVFYDGIIETEEQFLAHMKYGDVLFYILTDKEKTLGYTWLDRFENRMARQHFCVFKQYWGKSLDLGRSVLDALMHMKDKDGAFLFDLLTGYVPAWNKKAVSFALKCGGKTYGKIPNAIWNPRDKKSEDAIFIYYTRKVNE